MSGASFERIDYQLRNNKHIERRLIFDRLSRGSALIDYTNYRYIGFGSMWFVDFRLAHRILGIPEMISMERAEHAERAFFNRPFSCTEVVYGDCSDTVAEMSTGDWSKPMVCWLDYDGALDGTMVSDVSAFLDKVASGSVVTVTVNADFRNYRPRNQSGPRSRAQTTLGQVESLFGASVIPPRLDIVHAGSGSHPDVSAHNFPELLAVSMLSWMLHYITKANRTTVSSAGQPAKKIQFLPLFNYCHKDGVDMVTVGGAVVDEDSISAWKNQIAFGLDWSTLDKGLPVHERLDLIPLTVKEKLALDSCLPRSQSDYLRVCRDKGLQIEEQQLSKYRKYYRQFPLFFETSA